VFYLEPKVLRGAIRVEGVGDGFVAYIDEAVFDRRKCKLKQIKQLDKVKADRVPVFGLLGQSDFPVAYESESLAVMSLLLHLLFNLRRIIPCGRSTIWSRQKNWFCSCL
jgi:hypothetical protein